ncbi:MFS transporter [Mycolicibacterium smegmatis]|uniref:Membrane transport protein n=1 Tax=Mycolicibacterium smegmatis (strain MKD8) TaxID=1214915 RepID=A0A2U9Q011_MYCSE|nr:MFS transporter [Mycolicibacterium smegmatis]AWT57328.1 membrane transport protein [Mycolicibacterium smegmatis MKD8]
MPNRKAVGVGRPAKAGFLVAALAGAGISVSLMQTLVIPLIPQLPTLLSTSPANASWAITATLLTGAVATPVLGRLGDMYGPKRILIVCAALLVAGSVVAATTTSLIPLIIGRALQGFGAPVIPLGISVLRASLPAERVGAAMGLMSASLGVGGALGLPLSAVIAQHFDWHALFWCAAALGLASVLLFVFLVPDIPPVSGGRFDPFGALTLAAGLVMLLLPISKGATWGWGSTTTLGLFASAVVTFAVFGWWQYRAPSPIVDVRTTLRRPVLLTNLASIAVGFGMFAMSLVGPQLLQMPSETGYGLGQSMIAAGLWMAPGGLAMMVAAPLAARVVAARGPKFALIVGSAVIATGYLLGTQLLGSPVGVLVFSLVVSSGVGFAFAAMPALINAAVPVSETAAANGINTLARSLGTSTSSAVMSAVLAQMTVTLAGHVLPSLDGFRTALFIAAGAAAGAALIALAIPRVGSVRATACDENEPATVSLAVSAPSPATAPSQQQVRDLEAALTSMHRVGGRRWLDRPAYLVMSRIDAAGRASLDDLAVGADRAETGRQLTRLVRDALVRADARAGLAPVFSLTRYGHERLEQQRAQHVQGLGRAVADWEDGDVAALIGYLERLGGTPRPGVGTPAVQGEPETERLAVRRTVHAPRPPQHRERWIGVRA